MQVQLFNDEGLYDVLNDCFKEARIDYFVFGINFDKREGQVILDMDYLKVYDFFVGCIDYDPGLKNDIARLNDMVADSLRWYTYIFRSAYLIKPARGASFIRIRFMLGHKVWHETNK